MVDSRPRSGEDRDSSIIRKHLNYDLVCRAIALIMVAVGSACTAIRVDSTSEDRSHEYLHEAVYFVSCNISDECRVTYTDDSGTLRAKDITGDWDYELGVDPGRRLWLRATAAGCPPRSVLVEIQIDGANDVIGIDLHAVGQGFDEPRSTQRIHRSVHTGFMSKNLLRAQRNANGGLGRQSEMH